MPKRDRQPEHWGSLVPHNSMHGRRPVPLSRPTVVIGKGGDVRAPSNPHLSRHHIRLEREGDGSVYATHLSALNSTWLNGKRLEHDRRTLVEPCAGNAPYSLTGEAPDAPLLFVSVPNAASARAAARRGSSTAGAAGRCALSERATALPLLPEPPLRLPQSRSEAERLCSETIFRGVRLLLAARLGDKLRELQEEVVRRGGGEVVSDVREATHLALESDRRPSELACLAALPEAEWPRLVTKEWVGQCSKVLSADGSRTDVLRKNLHPSAVAAAREPASPEASLKRAKEEARAKAKKGKAARTHQHQQSWGPREINASKHRCLLAETYEKEEDDERLAEEVWIATEKFDGVRMRWEGHERGFTGRNGQGHFQPPDSFKALLPEEHLDGELWAGRCRFSAVGSLQGTKGLGRRLHEMAWHSLTYVVFDAPQVAGPYMQRLEAARRALAAVGPPDGRIIVAPAVRVADATAKDALLQRVIAKRGEGLVLRRDEAWWRRNVLKVKQWLDAEAVIVGHKNAHTTGNLPTVLVRALNAPNASPSIEFELSVERPSPEALKQRTLLEDLQLRFPVDTIVTFVYRQISKGSGAPTIPGGAPKIMRVHPFDCDCCVCRPEGDDTT
ncbi:hypothetical protein EMIHUDRAFT_220211 [Emiliania huxleyi CCMP1516]|uniref:DNA ligase n=2 Tax=Emiliania huxleyi TaxID=2903 RepID=A0A0D3I1I8_EMIH1|nr:hypothetical protein EMIHUDRAFT_220211 [Emiliania huxleyi CCMP1516]EOD05123.1 hypothetical protein EMIHUDRAFT_220211 [Emiliania huxleyi CCMP1516]|eukprot:XP_005757552.1 hypothetical protein EMIHUDRAFT_220211 [Emiliania huxleyi CCMP1516]